MSQDYLTSPETNKHLHLNGFRCPMQRINDSWGIMGRAEKSLSIGYKSFVHSLKTNNARKQLGRASEPHKMCLAPRPSITTRALHLPTPPHQLPRLATSCQLQLTAPSHRKCFYFCSSVSHCDAIVVSCGGLMGHVAARGPHC